MDNVRGLDHIGITVPDIELATRFLADAFRAEVIYEPLTRAEAPKAGSDAEHTLNLEHGTKITAVRMIRLQHGPGIELFEMHGPKQRSPQRPSDFGLQHFAVYVDDMAAAVARFEAAGGTLFGPPGQPFPLERGDGNLFCYGRAPWGGVIELITYPSPQPYEQQTSLRRWHP